jgi:hypothetical protein
MSEPRSDPRLTTARIVWGGLLGSAIVYLPIGLAVRAAGAGGADPGAALPIVLAVVALVDTALSFVLPAQIFRNAVRARKLAVVEEVDPAAMPGAYRAEAPKVRVFKTPAKAESAAVAAGMTSMVVQLAMREMVALLGFVLLFLGLAPVVWAPFFAVGWITLAMAWPSRRAWIGWVERAYGARLPEQPS